MISILPRHAEFHVPFSRAECVSRLQESLGSSFNPFSSNRFVGSASAWRVSVRKNISYRNSWQTVFVGHAEETDIGSTLFGTFRMNLFVAIFTLCWMGIVGLVWLAWFFSVVAGDADPVGLLMISGMFVFANALVVFGRYLARCEKHEIAAFFHEVLGATEVR